VNIAFITLLFVNICHALENEYFSMDAPKGWTIELGKSENDVKELKFSIKDEMWKEIICVLVNKDNNNYISCFCAPEDEYEKIKIGNQDAMRLIYKKYSYTLKVKGNSASIDIHKSFNETDDITAIRKTIESIKVRK
jgi:hypothetical protein